MRQGDNIADEARAASAAGLLSRKIIDRVSKSRRRLLAPILGVCSFSIYLISALYVRQNRVSVQIDGEAWLLGIGTILLFIQVPVRHSWPSYAAAAVGAALFLCRSFQVVFDLPIILGLTSGGKIYFATDRKFPAPTLYDSDLGVVLFPLSYLLRTAAHAAELLRSSRVGFMFLDGATAPPFFSLSDPSWTTAFNVSIPPMTANLLAAVVLILSAFFTGQVEFGRVIRCSMMLLAAVFCFVDHCETAVVRYSFHRTNDGQSLFTGTFASDLLPPLVREGWLAPFPIDHSIIDPREYEVTMEAGGLNLDVEAWKELGLRRVVAAASAEAFKDTKASLTGGKSVNATADMEVAAPWMMSGFPGVRSFVFAVRLATISLVVISAANAGSPILRACLCGFVVLVMILLPLLGTDIVVGCEASAALAGTIPWQKRVPDPPAGVWRLFYDPIYRMVPGRRLSEVLRSSWHSRTVNRLLFSIARCAQLAEAWAIDSGVANMPDIYGRGLNFCLEDPRAAGLFLTSWDYIFCVFLPSTLLLFCNVLCCYK